MEETMFNHRTNYSKSETEVETNEHFLCQHVMRATSYQLPSLQIMLHGE